MAGFAPIRAASAARLMRASSRCRRGVHALGQDPARGIGTDFGVWRAPLAFGRVRDIGN
jgi:hypothetical protein